MVNKSNRDFRLFLFILVILSFTFTVKSGTLVVDGRANSVIVVGTEVPDSVKLAANELQSYIEQVTDVKVPIEAKPSADDSMTNVFVGQSQYVKELGVSVDGLGSDGFRIVAKDNWIVIIGRDYAGPVICGKINPWRYHETYSPNWKVSAFGETGTLYGVYEFLQRSCGIRWYMPGELGTVVPKTSRLEVGSLDINEEPDFEYRYPWLCNFSETDDEPIWYRRVGFGAVAPVQITHSFREMLKYKDTHPEYFALIDGKRDFTNLSTAYPNGNLCLSNPGLIEQWSNDICEYFDANPAQQVYSVSPEDGMYRICDCKDCQSQIDLQVEENGQFSNYVWGFIDKVARRVSQRYPDKYIGCIAYGRYNTPPTCIDKLSPNVAVMICKLRVTYYNPEGRERVNRSIVEWKKKASRLYVWEYYLQSWLPWQNLPVSFSHIISDDLKFLKGLSSGEFVECESWRAGEADVLPNKMNFPGMQHLNIYVTGRLYWNTDLDVDALLAEYFKLFYGPAEKEMKEFWLTSENYWMNQDRSEAMVGFGGGNPVKLFTPERLKKLTGFLESSKAKTSPESVYRKRIDLIASEFNVAAKKLSNDRVVNIPKLTISSTDGKTIVIDGKITDLPWENVKPETFVDLNGYEPEFDTKAYITWDGDNLYFAFENIEPEMDKLCVKATQRDQAIAPALWDEDCMEIFICPDPNNRKTCYQFIINAKGVVLDASYGIGGVDRNWNSGIITSSSLLADRWVLETKIPFKDIAINSPADGKTIAVNIYRSRNCGKGIVSSCWSSPLEMRYMSPDRFGEITFHK
jgi:hypothetical protein